MFWERGLTRTGTAILALGLLTSVGHAQEIGNFEQIPATQSPVRYHAPFNAKAVHMRQYRPNSTVFVGRWIDQSGDDGANGPVFAESVFSISAPGYAFHTETKPDSLLNLFQGLKGQAKANGDNFDFESKYGPMALTPFVRGNAQCISFVAQWTPATAQKRGSRLLGYYCEPLAVQNAPQHETPPTRITPDKAKDFAKLFFLRFNVKLPDDVGTPTSEASDVPQPALQPLPAAPGADDQSASEPMAQTAPQKKQDAVVNGVAITTNWNGVRGTGILKFDKPAGEGTMVIDDAQRHCEGYWRHEGGSYTGTTNPFGSWSVFCKDGSSARGRYVSSDASSVNGDGQDDKGQTVYFREKTQ